MTALLDASMWRWLVFVCVLGATGGARAADPAAWARIGGSDDVAIEGATVDGVERVRATTTLPYDYAEVRAVVMDLPQIAQWWKLSLWQLISLKPGSVDAVIYGRRALLHWPFADRDFVVRFEWRDVIDTCVLEGRPTTVGAPPRHDGVVRLTTYAPSWRLTRDGPRTRVVYEWTADLGGSFPSFLRSSVWEQEAPASIAALAAEVQRRRDDRNAPPPSGAAKRQHAGHSVDAAL